MATATNIESAFVKDGKVFLLTEFDNGVRALVRYAGTGVLAQAASTLYDANGQLPAPTQVATRPEKTAEEAKQTLRSRLNENRSIDMIQFKGLFNHENRIRALESRPAMTLEQFEDLILSQVT